MARRAPARAARRPRTSMSVGQLGLFGSPEPWQPSRDCRCWPVDVRACEHCRTCDTCQDCGRCAGRGCSCGCDD